MCDENLWKEKTFRHFWVRDKDVSSCKETYMQMMDVIDLAHGHR